MELVFFFVDKEEARCKNLEERINQLKLPDNFKVRVECDTFEQAFGTKLAEIEQQSKSLAPSFVFIDPFGPTGFPMPLIERLAQQPRSEVLITFNYQSLNQCMSIALDVDRANWRKICLKSRPKRGKNRQASQKDAGIS